MMMLAERLLLAGYTAKSILDFLSKKISGLSKSIHGARSGGYSDDDILKFLSNKLPGSRSREADQSASQADQYLSGIGLRTKEERAVRRQKGLQAITGLLPAALGAYGLYRGISSLGQAINPSEILTETLQQPGIGNVPKAPVAPTIPVPNAPQLTAASPSPIAAAPAIRGAEEIIPAVKDPLQEMGLKEKVNTMLSAGNAPDVISNAILQQLTPGQKKWVGENKVNLKQAIEEHAKTQPTKQPEVPPVSSSVPAQATSEIAPIEQPKTETNKLVALPNGNVGQVESVKGKVIRVNDNGKIRHFKYDDVVMEPEEVVNFANAVAKIPESERSSNIDLVTYDPRGHLGVKFRGDKHFYQYLDVPREDFEAISKGHAIPKTSGKTTTGEMWEAATPGSFGAALIQRVISNPKYAKAQEGETWFKGEVGYHLLKALDIRPKLAKESSEKKSKKEKKPKNRPIAG